MAKKKQSPQPAKSFFKPFVILTICLSLGLVSWNFFTQDSISKWKDEIFRYVDNPEIATLETRFSPEQVIEANTQDILASGKRTLKRSSLIYYPYLMLKVKYASDNQTKEGTLLWGLNQGEMVINSDSWEETHGFRDCLECKANAHDFKIIQALAKKTSGQTADELEKELRIEKDVLTAWLNDAKLKHLIVQNGNVFSLHFENPKLLVAPQTKIQHALVTKNQGNSEKAVRNFSRSQVITLLQAAFGPKFTIRSDSEIFLPVYRFEAINKDGSVQVSFWNAITGKKIIS